MVPAGWPYQRRCCPGAVGFCTSHHSLPMQRNIRHNEQQSDGYSHGWWHVIWQSTTAKRRGKTSCWQTTQRRAWTPTSTPSKRHMMPLGLVLNDDKQWMQQTKLSIDDLCVLIVLFRFNCICLITTLLVLPRMRNHWIYRFSIFGQIFELRNKI